MSQFKYVIISKQGLEIPRLGTVLEEHGELKREHEKVIAGGFVQIDVKSGLLEFNESNLVFTCYGKSFGLKVESRGKEDGKLIEKAYNLSY